MNCVPTDMLLTLASLRGLELGTADVAYCSNLISVILVCERIYVQGAWL